MENGKRYKCGTLACVYTMKKEVTLRLKLYQEVCNRIGAVCTVLDDDSELLKVSLREEFFIVPFSGLPPLNSASANTLAKDKVFTKRILNEAGIKAPAGEHFFVSGKHEWVPTEKTIQDAHAYAHSQSFPVFVKPHNQSRGRASLQCHSEEELKAQLKEVAEVSHVAIIEEYIAGREGRIFCIDGAVEFLYYKMPNNEGKGNISAGATIVDYRDANIPTELEVLGRKVFQAFGGDLRVYAIDFVVPDAEALDAAVVLEVNGVPSVIGVHESGSHKTVQGLWEKLVRLYFGLSQS